MFEGMEIISCYTWDDAVNDGMFVEVTERANKLGFCLPVAITSNLYESHLRKDNDEDTGLEINGLLMGLAIHIKMLKERGEGQTSMIEYPATFDNSDIVTTVWATIEGRSPSNPEPVMTIMLPEDY